MFAHPDYQYRADAAYPGELEDFKRNTWQHLAYDSDSTHVSEVTKTAIKSAIGCTIAGERIGNPLARVSIEQAFQLYASEMTWLPSATGNRPFSPVRRDPETGAEKYFIVPTLLEQVIDLLTRNYNATPTTANDGLSPLQMLQHKLLTNEIFHSPVGDLSPEKLWMLLPVYPAKLNRRGTAGRFGPFYVELFGAQYTSTELANDPELNRLSNFAVRLYVQEDARFGFVVPVEAPHRVFKVAISGKYSETPHSLEWRRICSTVAKNNRIADKAANPNVMIGVLHGLAEVAKAERPAAILLSGITAFIERYSAGQTPAVSMSHDDLERLLETAQALDIEEDADDDSGVPLPVGQPNAAQPAPPSGMIF